MARLNTKLSIEAPQEITVPLVRADYLDSSNIFRVFFEIFLSVTSTLFGVYLTSESTSTLHTVFMVVMGVSTLSFLGLSIYFYQRAKP